MRRTFAVILLAFLVIAVPFYMTAQTSGGVTGMQQSAQPRATSGQPGSMTGSATGAESPGSGRTYGEVNQPNSPGYAPDDARGGFDFGWLGLLGLAGLLGLRHTNRNPVVTR